MLYKYRTHNPYNGIITLVTFDMPAAVFKSPVDRTEAVKEHSRYLFYVNVVTDEPYLAPNGQPDDNILEIPAGALRLDVTMDRDCPYGKSYILEIPTKQNLRTESILSLMAQLEIPKADTISIRTDGVTMMAYRTGKPTDTPKRIRVAISPKNGPDFIAEFHPNDMTRDGVKAWAETVLPNLKQVLDWRILPETNPLDL